MKKLFLLLFSMIIFSCNNEYVEFENNKKISKIDEKGSVIKVINELYPQKETITKGEITNVLSKNLKKDFYLQTTRATQKELYTISEPAANIYDKIMAVNPTNYETKEKYINKILFVFRKNSDNISDSEFKSIRTSILIASHIIDLYLQEKELQTRGFWDSVRSHWNKWGKCASGIIGGALTEGLAGALGGSVVPAVGTTIGGVVGAIGGGFTGASLAC